MKYYMHIRLIQIHLCESRLASFQKSTFNGPKIEKNLISLVSSQNQYRADMQKVKLLWCGKNIKVPHLNTIYNKNFVPGV